jgi:hypothetical protein
MANAKTVGSSIGYTVEITNTLNAGLVSGRFIKSDGSDYASTADLSAGVTFGAEPGQLVCADNEEVSLAVSGVVAVQAGAAVARFAKVESNAAGKAITLNAGILRGVALDEATADGDPIRVLLTTLNGTVA